MSDDEPTNNNSTADNKSQVENKILINEQQEGGVSANKNHLSFSFSSSSSQRKEGRAGNIPQSRDEIKNKFGNYLFTIGGVSSGKSTFHSHFLRWVFRGNELSSELMRCKEGGKNIASLRLNSWRDLWDENKFPKSTATGLQNITELQIKSTPLKGETTPLVFNILEMSGEDLQLVIPDDQVPHSGTIYPQLIEYLRNSNIKIILVMIVDPERKNNDILFQNFLDHFEEKIGLQNHFNRLSPLILVTKPQKALERMRSENTSNNYKNLYDDYTQLNSELCERYLENYLPETYARVAGWKGSIHRYSWFYIGDINEDNQLVYDNPCFKDAKNIFRWMYYYFTGKEYGHTFWQRLLKSLWSEEG